MSGLNGLIAPQDLANAYWFVHKTPHQAGTFELDQRSAKEAW